jgi:hypothetical protein
MSLFCDRCLQIGRSSSNFAELTNEDKVLVTHFFPNVTGEDKTILEHLLRSIQHEFTNPSIEEILNECDTNGKPFIDVLKQDGKLKFPSLLQCVFTAYSKNDEAYFLTQTKGWTKDFKQDIYGAYHELSNDKSKNISRLKSDFLMKKDKENKTMFIDWLQSVKNEPPTRSNIVKKFRDDFSGPR